LLVKKQFRLGKLLKVVPSENKIILHNGEMSYDHLVLQRVLKRVISVENVKRYSNENAQ
jgi:NADH dehydrogenase